jgi:hypothetical protein
MKVCIVGHGPSLQRERRGPEIDEFDKVIRQKRSETLLEHPEHYGTRTDIACYSLKLIQLGHIQLKADEYWSFVDSRFSKVKAETFEILKKKFEKKYGAPLRIDKDICDFWNETYREMRTPFTRHPQQSATPYSDDLGHLHMSAGLHTLVSACYFLRPKEIVLAGYDSVVSGDWTWSAARGEKWNAYADHRFDVEHEMLPIIASTYDVEIRPL